MSILISVGIWVDYCHRLKYTYCFFICFVYLFGMSGLVFAATDDKGTPPSIGNFALSDSQQPGPFLSFGQTLIGRSHLQLSFATFSPFHITGPFDNENAALTYGITDDTSLYFNYPIVTDSRSRLHAFHGSSSGLRNISLQLEQAIWSVENTQYQTQTTILGAISLPTQEIDTVKITRGYAAPSYFLGTTYTRTYVDWMGFVSPGVDLTSTSNHVRLGSQFLYQAGLGRNIVAVSHQSMLFVLLELDGQYTEKTQVLGFDNPNSGGNVIALTPSLMLATQSTMTQVGVGFPLVQNLYGNQKKMDYFIAAQFTWTVA